MGETKRGQLKEIYRQKNEPNDRRAIRGTRYGNPYKIGDPHPDTGEEMTRDDVCDLFEQLVLPTLDIRPLKGKRILCTCELNERCHVDSIIQKIEESNAVMTHDTIKAAVNQIKGHHNDLLFFMAKADKRAEAIGLILLDLHPILKSEGISITQLCEELPFGKSVAYEYMAVARGKTTWGELNSKKRTVQISAAAEKAVVARMPKRPQYNINEAMGAITGMAWLYVKNYEGTTQDAANVLVSELLTDYNVDDIGTSIARDRMQWFLKFKDALDLAEPEIRKILATKPDLKVVC